MPKFRGTIVSISRFPGKSMQGQQLDAAHIGSNGIPGDRYVALEGMRSKKLLTARHCPELLHVQPTLWDATKKVPYPSGYKPVRTDFLFPNGETTELEDPCTLEQFAQLYDTEPLRIITNGHGQHDKDPVSLISVQTARAIAQTSGIPVSADRFRMNLVVDWQDDTPYLEELLVGNDVSIGRNVRAVFTERNIRCQMMDYDSKTGEKQPLLSWLVANRQQRAGVYLQIGRQGVVGVGDQITINPLPKQQYSL